MNAYEITSEISEIPAICKLWSYVCHLMPLPVLYCGILKLILFCSVLFYLNLFLTVLKDECMLFHAQTSFKKTLALITAEITFLLAISELINCI